MLTGPSIDQVLLAHGLGQISHQLELQIGTGWLRAPTDRSCLQESMAEAFIAQQILVSPGASLLGPLGKTGSQLLPTLMAQKSLPLIEAVTFGPLPTQVRHGHSVQ
jgi:hypothetical protein